MESTSDSDLFILFSDWDLHLTTHTWIRISGNEEALQQLQQACDDRKDCCKDCNGCIVGLQGKVVTRSEMEQIVEATDNNTFIDGKIDFPATFNLHEHYYENGCSLLPFVAINYS